MHISLPLLSGCFARDSKPSGGEDASERSNGGSRRGSNQVNPDTGTDSKLGTGDSLKPTHGGRRRSSQVSSSTENAQDTNKDDKDGDKINRSDIPKITVELVDEVDPNAVTPVSRRRLNEYKPKHATSQDAEQKGVERKRSNSASSTASSGSDRSVASERTVNSRKVLLSDDYYLHNFRHTRTSLNQSVCPIKKLPSFNIFVYVHT